VVVIHRAPKKTDEKKTKKKKKNKKKKKQDPQKEKSHVNSWADSFVFNNPICQKNGNAVGPRATKWAPVKM